MTSHWLITRKAVKGQLDRDKKICDLVTVMKEVYSFVDALATYPEKIEILEVTILAILKQTVECTFFIREYCNQGFRGMFLWLSDVVSIHMCARTINRTDLWGSDNKD